MSIMRCDVCDEFFDSDYILPTCTSDCKCACENCMEVTVAVALHAEEMKFKTDEEALEWYLKLEAS